MVGFWMMSSHYLFENRKSTPDWVGGFNGEHSLISFLIPNVGWPMSFAGIGFLIYMFKPD